MEFNAVFVYTCILPILVFVASYFCVKAHQRSQRLSTIDKVIGVFVLGDTINGLTSDIPYFWIRFVKGTTAGKSSGFLSDVVKQFTLIDKRGAGADPTMDATVVLFILSSVHALFFFNSLAHGKSTRFFWQTVYASMQLVLSYYWIGSDFFGGFKNMSCPTESVAHGTIWAVLILRALLQKYMCWQAYQASQGKRGGRSTAPQTPSSPRHGYNLRSKSD